MTQSYRTIFLPALSPLVACLSMAVLSLPISAEEYQFSRQEAVSKLCESIVITSDRAFSEVSEEDIPKTKDLCGTLIERYAKEMLPETLSAVSKDAFQRMFGSIQIASADPDYLEKTLRMRVSYVSATVKYQRIYPPLTEAERARFKAQINSLFEQAEKTLEETFGTLIPAQLITKHSAKSREKMLREFDNPTLRVLRAPCADAVFAEMMSVYAQSIPKEAGKFRTEIEDLGKIMDPKKQALAKEQASDRMSARLFANLVHQYSLATIPDEIEHAKPDPEHRKHMEAAQKAASVVSLRIQANRSIPVKAPVPKQPPSPKPAQVPTPTEAKPLADQVSVPLMPTVDPVRAPPSTAPGKSHIVVLVSAAAFALLAVLMWFRAKRVVLDKMNNGE